MCAPSNDRFIVVNVITRGTRHGGSGFEKRNTIEILRIAVVCTITRVSIDSAGRTCDAQEKRETEYNNNNNNNGRGRAS